MDSLPSCDPSPATILHTDPLPWPSDLAPAPWAPDVDSLLTSPDALERLAQYVLADADHRRRAASYRLWNAYQQRGQGSEAYREAWETWSRAYAIWREVADIVGPVPYSERSTLQDDRVLSDPDGG
jgi:hypothetical protein